ncbi:MAG: endonuclease III domain-containing protein [Sedimentisphaerales bacterium]|nr:endonuclease III domain-containing protein [Sedimentisphaerales bacterium]
MSRTQLMEIYKRLLDHYGPQHWWPGESPFEVMIGAILTQNTNWQNVEKAIGNLKRANCLSPEAMHTLKPEALAELIRPAGYYNIKAQRLKNFLDWLFTRFEGNLSRIEPVDTYSLREELLVIHGIGAETADSILLYALNRCVFVVDAYTCRVLARHGLLEPDAGYEQVREMFESTLPQEIQLYNEYHALLVRLGKDYCKSKPKCSGCPLEEMPHEIEPW